jgi:hypothetical protein
LLFPGSTVESPNTMTAGAELLEALGFARALEVLGMKINR